MPIQDKIKVKKCCLICRFYEDPPNYDSYCEPICWLNVVKSRELKKEGKPHDNVPYISTIDDEFKMNCDGWFELNKELL